MHALAIVGASLAGLSAARAARAQGYVPSVVESGMDVSASVELFHRVNQQDFEDCERCQPAMGSKIYAKGGVLVPSEHHIGVFQDWIQEVVGDVIPTT